MSTNKTISDQLIEALEGSDTFVLGDPYESEYMKRLITLIDEEKRRLAVRHAAIESGQAQEIMLLKARIKELEAEREDK